MRGCNVSHLTAARPKVDYETNIDVRRLLEGKRWEEAGAGNLTEEETSVADVG